MVRILKKCYCVLWSKIDVGIYAINMHITAFHRFVMMQKLRENVDKKEKQFSPSSEEPDHRQVAW